MLLLAGACAGGDPAPADAPNTMRFIVGFEAGGDTAFEPTHIMDTLRRALEGEVEYLHAIGGNAAVYRVTTPLDNAALERRLAQLEGRAPIRYAEPDRRHHNHSSTKDGKQ
jgi:hypothetical protein